jgi:hypothetical protein
MLACGQCLETIKFAVFRRVLQGGRISLDPDIVETSEIIIVAVKQDRRDLGYRRQRIP